MFSALVDTGLKPGMRQESEGGLGQQKLFQPEPAPLLHCAWNIQCITVPMPHMGEHNTSKTKLGDGKSVGAVKINLFSSAFFTGNITKVLYRV